MEMFRNARSHITICCSYFRPGNHSAPACTGFQRGVKIRIIIAGPSDVMVAKMPNDGCTTGCSGIISNCTEYQASVLHAKVAVCDGEWATVGSYNINKISAYASIELNLDVRGSEFSTELENQLSSIITRDCVKSPKKRTCKKRTGGSSSYAGALISSSVDILHQHILLQTAVKSIIFRGIVFFAKFSRGFFQPALCQGGDAV